MKRFLILLLYLLGCTNIFISAAEIDTQNNQNTLSIEKELDQCEKVYSSFGQRSMFEASNYVPEGSEILSVDKIGECVTIDYKLDNQRYIVDYFSDGHIEKTVRATDSRDIYRIDSIKRNIEHINIDEIIESTERTEEEANQIIESLKQSDIHMSNEIPIQTRSSKKDVFPLKYTSVSSTKPFNAKKVSSGTVTIPALKQVGYKTSQRYRVYNTMDYYTELERRGPSFNAGDAISVLAAALDVAKTKMISWLSAAGVAYSATSKLTEACRVVDEHSYKYLGGKEVTIYDPTQFNTDVEVLNEWADGKISLYWKYNGKYNSPSWGHTVRSTALQISNTDAKNQAKDIYNTHITLYGVWKWGVGKLGY